MSRKSDILIDMLNGRMPCKECQEFDCYLCPFKINLGVIDIIETLEEEREREDDGCESGEY